MKEERLPDAGSVAAPIILPNGEVYGAISVCGPLSRFDRAAIHRYEPMVRAARGGTPDQAPFASAIEDYYFTNAIARCSPIMAECSAIAEGHGALRAAE